MGRQEIVSEVEASLNQNLEQAMMERGVEELFVVSHAPWKYGRRGAPYLIKAISAAHDRLTGAAQASNEKDSAKVKVVRWVVQEISTRVSNGIVKFTVNKVTSSNPQGSQTGGGVTAVDSSMSVQLPTWSEKESLVLLFEMKPIVKVDSVEVKVTGEFDGDVVIRVQGEGAKLQSVEFKDCALNLSASFPWGIHRSFKVPVKGTLVV